MPTAKRRGRAAPKPYHHGHLRETLLDAADRLLSERGKAALTLRDVAKQAGVSHAAPYHHFASLDALLAAVAQRSFSALADAMENADGQVDARERLLAICEAYVRFALRHPAQFRLMFGALLARKREFPALQQAADRAFDALLRAAVAFRPDSGPLLALSGWSLAHGIANLAIDGVLAGLPFALPEPGVVARQMSVLILDSAGNEGSAASAASAAAAASSATGA